MTDNNNSISAQVNPISNGTAPEVAPAQEPTMISAPVEQPTETLDPEAIAGAIFDELGEPFVVNDNGKVEMNQRAVAKAFTHTRRMQYDPTTKQFCHFATDTGLWVPDLAERTHQEMAQCLAHLGEQKRHENFVQRQKEATINSLVKFAKANDVKPTITDTNGLFHVANGVLDLNLEPPVLHGHSPAYPFRKSSLLRYDAQARCPRFQDELLAPAMDQDDQRLLQKLLGAMLLGENQAQKILLIRGTAGGGKSTLVSVVEKILGEHHVAYLRAKNLNGRFETAGFIGRRVLVGKDVPGDTLSEKGARLLKSLTGGDLMEGEIKFQQHRPQLKGNFHVVIVSNNHLRIALDGDEQAWERRLVTVEFNREKPAKAIVNLADTLVAEEGPGILNWLVEGAKCYRDELRDGGRIVMTEAQKHRVFVLLHNSDSARAFIEQHVRLAPDMDVSSAELLTAYVDRCKANGWQTVSAKEFQKTAGDELLSRHNIHQRHDILRNGGPVRGFKGLTVA